MSLLESLATATTKIDFEIELSCVEEYIDGIYTKDFLQFALDASKSNKWECAKCFSILFWAYELGYDGKANLDSAMDFLESDYKKLVGGYDEFSWAEFYDSLICFNRKIMRRTRFEFDKQNDIFSNALTWDQVDLQSSLLYCRAFNRILKRGSDSTSTDNALFSIISNKTLSKSKKISLMEGFQRNHALSLGSDQEIPNPIVCFEHGHHYLFKYFAGLSGIEDIMAPNGDCLFTYLSYTSPFMKYLKLFDQQALETMLMKRNSDGTRGVDSVTMFKCFKQFIENPNYYNPIESLFKKNLLTLEEANKILQSVGSESISIKLDREAKKQEENRLKDLEIEQKRLKSADLMRRLANLGGSEIDKEIWAQSGSSFNLSDLPLELITIILMDLDGDSIRSSFCASKQMSLARERLGNEFFAKAMQRSFLQSYGTVSNIINAPIWQKEFYSRCRRINSWKKKQFTQTSIDVWPKYSNLMRNMDENWIISGSSQSWPAEGVEGSVLKLYDLHNSKSLQRYSHHPSDFNGSCDFLESRAGEFPNLVINSCSRITLINGKENHKFYLDGVGRSDYVTSIDKTTIFVTNMKFNLEQRKIICKWDQENHIFRIKYNKGNKMSLALVGKSSCIHLLDENMQDCSKMDVTNYMKNKGYLAPQITWIDDFTAMLNHKFLLLDTRMMTQPVYESLGQMEYIGGALGLFGSGSRESQIWDLNKLEPIQTLPICLSDRYLCSTGHALYDQTLLTIN